TNQCQKYDAVMTGDAGIPPDVGEQQNTEIHESKFQDEQWVACDQPACDDRHRKHQCHQCQSECSIGVRMSQCNEITGRICAEMRNTRSFRMRNEYNGLPNRTGCKRHQGAKRNPKTENEAVNAESLSPQGTIISRWYHRAYRQHEENEIHGRSCNGHGPASN